MLDRLRHRATRFLLGRIDARIASLTARRARLAGADLGAVAHAAAHKDDLVLQIRLLVHLRWGVHILVPSVLLLLAAQGIELTTERAIELGTEGPNWLVTLLPNMTVSAIGLALNGFYYFLLKRGRSLRPIAHAQVWLDALIFGVVIYGTGGSSSPFAFLYTIPVLAASMLLSQRASLAIAAFATALLATQAWLQFQGLIPNLKTFEPLLPLTRKGSYLLAMVTLNGLLYFLIAVTSGILSWTIRRHERTLARRATEATMLHEVSSTLQELTHLDEVLRGIMDILVRKLEIDRALMYLVNDAGTALELKVVSYHPRWADAPRDDLRVEIPIERSSGVTAICALEKKVFNVTDPQNHPLINRELAQRIGLNAFAVAPMLARGTVVGVIGCDRKFQKGIIAQEEAQTLAIAANQAGLTIQNAELYAEFAEGSQSCRIVGSRRGPDLLSGDSPAGGPTP